MNWYVYQSWESNLIIGKIFLNIMGFSIFVYFLIKLSLNSQIYAEFPFWFVSGVILYNNEVGKLMDTNGSKN